MSIRLKRYKKDFEHSYSFGVYPTLEMLTHRPQDAIEIVAHPKGAENRGITKIQEICQKKAIPFEFQEKRFSRIGARENDYAIGVYKKFEPGLDASANHVILVNPSGMGNLGTIIRTMLGFSFQNLGIIEPAADIFHPDVTRASMGAVFQIRFSQFVDFESYQKSHPRNFYLLMTDGEVPLPKARFKPPFGLIFGPENSGLPSDFQHYGTSISIPQSSAIDSLNLAVSVGVTLFHATTAN